MKSKEEFIAWAAQHKFNAYTLGKGYRMDYEIPCFIYGIYRSQLVEQIHKEFIRLLNEWQAKEFKRAESYEK